MKKIAIPLLVKNMQTLLFHWAKQPNFSHLVVPFPFLYSRTFQHGLFRLILRVLLVTEITFMPHDSSFTVANHCICYLLLNPSTVSVLRVNIYRIRHNTEPLLRVLSIRFLRYLHWYTHDFTIHSLLYHFPRSLD